jgi:cell division protein FtsA
MARLETLTALDIGTSKVVCVMAEFDSAGDLEIVARGVRPCRGLRRGALVDAEEAVRSIEAAVAEAEKFAGYTAGPALVGLTSQYLCSQPSHGVWPVGNAEGQVARTDVQRVIEAARMVGIPSDREIVHVIPRGFAVDGQTGIRNPLGLSGLRLEVDAHVVAASTAYLANVRNVVNKAGLELDPEGLVASSLASSLAVLTEEERELGTAMVDIGLGATDFAVYCGGEVGHSAVLPVAGELLIHDLARFFRIPPLEAERLMLEAGLASPEFLEAQEDQEMEAPAISGEGKVKISRRQLAEVLEARLLEIFDWVGKQIEWSRKKLGLVVTSLVLTGGVAQLPGLALLAHRELQMPARVAAPCYPPGLPQNLCSPIYSTAVGLILYGATRIPRHEEPAVGNSPFKELVKRLYAMLVSLF